MQRYVAGLMFSGDGERVALVRKKRPTWQVGRLNAIGGKIESFDLTTVDAMIREFSEETGVLTRAHEWTPVAVLEGPEFQVNFYAAFSDSGLGLVRTAEDEVIEVFSTSEVLAYRTLIPNLKVIIPLALDDTGIVKPVALSDGRSQ